ncbi:MAG: RNA polymerase sigma factor [Planctomycetota bacterium]
MNSSPESDDLSPVQRQNSAADHNPEDIGKFEQLVEPHVQSMFEVARRILKSPDLAWDAVQDTLFRAWTGAGLPPEPRAALLHRARLSSLHIRRGERRREDREKHACLLHPRTLGPRADLSDAEAQEVHRGLETLIGSLPDDCQQVLWLRMCQKKSYDDIATALGVPVGTVRSRLSRARTMLRVCLDSVARRVPGAHGSS